MLNTQPYGNYTDPGINQDATAEHEFLKQVEQAFSARIQNDNWELQAYLGRSLVTDDEMGALVYSRTQEQACLIERLMGKDGVTASNFEVNCHPVIELRLTPDYFAVELALSPRAWWDQVNIVGKLTLPRHRIGLRTLLANIDENFCLGFWEGDHLSDMHLANWQLLHGNIFEEWMSTFCEGQDWLRIGRWYDHDAVTLNADFINGELLSQFKALYNLYEFVVWSGDNNFHRFHDA